MKISTWNLQGNGYNNMCSAVAEAKCRMINENIDVFCLQETGLIVKDDPGEKLLNCDNFVLFRNQYVGTKSRGLTVNLYVLKYGTTNFRCSMAILVKSEYDLLRPAIIPPYPGTNTREIFGVLLGNRIEDSVAVYNIHAPSGNSAFAKSYFAYALGEIDQLVNAHKIPNVVLAGDFNNEPIRSLEKMEDVKLVKNYQIVAQTDHQKVVPTHNSGGCLDYCCTTLPVRNTTVSRNAAYSDHRQVTFDF